jgi:MarR family transcriptional regulator, negative regulator of the multidrug operon emrRAB
MLWMEIERTSNLLGALSLAISDRIHAVASQGLGHGGETPAALTVIGHEPGLSNDMLRKILNLSHSGAVRLIDKLQAVGLVERRKGKDRREVALYLTEAGDALRGDILLKRADVLLPVVESLSPQEQKRLTTILEKMLRKLPGTKVETYSICRLCDEGVCQSCPIEELTLPS